MGGENVWENFEVLESTGHMGKRNFKEKHAEMFAEKARRTAEERKEKKRDE